MEITIMTFNMEYGGLFTNFTVEDYAGFLDRQNADIIGLQEVQRTTSSTVKLNSTAKSISKLLPHYYYFESFGGMAILSRYEILRYMGNESFCGIEIIFNGKVLRFFNIHLTDEPFTMFSLYRLPYNNTPAHCTVKEAIQLSYDSRKKEIENLLMSVNNNTIIFGDFNEPSHLDWTQKTFENKMVPAIVPWKISRLLAIHNFRDIIRIKYTDPVKYPMYTCDIIRKETQTNPACRIDLIYTNLPLVKSNVVSAKCVDSNLSDHLPVVVKLLI
jgi:exodeoxyribonuclease-3